MMPLSRKDQLKELYPDVPLFRFRQCEEALFDTTKSSFSGVSNLPLAMRETLDARIPWTSLTLCYLLESGKKDTYKAIIECADKQRVETVLMKNTRGQWTVCVSSQVGCAMACTFCATGKMGFTRNLISDEIIDQYRFWKIFLAQRSELPQRISNIVFMGMGEPLANYHHVRDAIRHLLDHTDVGPTRVTVSTVGLLPMMNHILKDPDWPPVRLAVSLHSADMLTRKKLMPSSFDAFLALLEGWTREYFVKNESHRRHLTFEYVMLSRINDTEKHAHALIQFARRVGKVRINLIPYNMTGPEFQGSSGDDFKLFENKLREAGVNVTRRRTMGDDIAAACGQLIVNAQATL